MRPEGGDSTLSPMNGFPEKDWKVFRDLHGTLIERFCERALKKVTDLSGDTQRDPCERFSAVSRVVREVGKDLNALSDHRRSTAFLVIARMHNHEELLFPEEFERFSQETRDAILRLSEL